MLGVLYKFQVKPGHEERFIESWKEMTRLIHKHEGGQGSRLHRNAATEFIAYAQWPDREAWEGAGDKLPEKAAVIRKTMREACSSIETLYDMDVVADLLEH